MVDYADKNAHHAFAIVALPAHKPPTPHELLAALVDAIVLVERQGGSAIASMTMTVDFPNQDIPEAAIIYPSVVVWGPISGERDV